MEKLNGVDYRQVFIPLSDSDCDKLAEKAGSVGMSVGDLLAHFIGDLVGGTFTSGSDERLFAEQWFDRCGWAMFPEPTFLRWLCENGTTDDFMGHYDFMKECEEDLCAEDPSDTEEANRQEIEYQRQWMESEYREFCACLKQKGLDPAESFETAVEKVVQWNKDRTSLKRSIQFMQEGMKFLHEELKGESYHG